MKILQLCKKFPFPLKDGESVAVTYLAKALSQLGCELTLLAMNTTKHPADVDNLPDSFDHYKNIYTVKVDNALRVTDALVNLAGSTSYHVSRYNVTAFRELLIKVLNEEEYDIVHLETLYLTPYLATIRQHSKAKIVLRSHNLEHEIWERVASNTNNFLKKAYLNIQVNRLKKYELDHLNAYDLMVPITKRDENSLKQLGLKIPSQTCPIGLRIADYPVVQPDPQKTITLSFIGSLDWMPNLEGLNWFLEEIWPKVIDRFPDCELHLAGRNTPDWLHKKASKNLIVHGEVDSAQQFILSHPVMIVPLLSGSGMRVKILESMALSRVTLTTSIGLEGIDAKDNIQALIADTPEEFVEKIAYCYQNPKAIKELCIQARTLIETEYDNVEIARKLFKSYKKILVTS